MVYESIEPFGDRRRDLQTAMIMSLLANINRTKRTDKVWAPKDFMPDWNKEPTKAQTIEEQMGMMKIIAEFQNASVKNRALLD